jgi:hypothetical protein
MESKEEEKKSEFESYVDVTDPIKETKSFDPIAWWQSVAEDFPTLHLYALDTLSCPAMSTECERAFSSAKKLLVPERNALSMDIIEACECLKTWWKNCWRDAYASPWQRAQTFAPVFSRAFAPSLLLFYSVFQCFPPHLHQE